MGGRFGPRRFISSQTTSASSVYAADFDGDGDTDVLSGSASAVSWFENLDHPVNVTPVLSDLPQGYRLFSAFPNPFGPGGSGSQTGGPYPETMIRYALPQRASVRLVVYNVQGQLVRVLVEAEQPAGRYEVSFEAGALPSGVYLYRLEAGVFQETRPMILLR